VINIAANSDAADRFAIRELIEAYSDALNLRDFTALAKLFMADAVWQVDAPFNLRFEGAEIARNIAGMVANFPFLMQMTHGIVVEIMGDRAKARSTVHEVGQAADGASGLDSVGIYYDELVRTPDGWRFAARRFHGLYLNAAPLNGVAIS
jgi:ketosteroid isomerase-like protein